MYKKCPKCEINYILADQELCDVCLVRNNINLQNNKVEYSSVEAPKRRNGKAVFFVFQNFSYSESEEIKRRVIIAPRRDKGGFMPHHWLRLTQVIEGDLIIHCTQGYIAALSFAKSKCYDSKFKDGREALAVDCDYILLNKMLNVSDYKDKIIQTCKNTYFQPFNKNGTGNQGYLFEINWELALTFLRKIIDDNEGMEQISLVKKFLNDVDL